MFEAALRLSLFHLLLFLLLLWPNTEYGFEPSLIENEVLEHALIQMSEVEKEAIAEAKAVILEHTPWVVHRRAFRSAYHVRLLQEDDRRDPEQDWSEDREQNFVEFSAHVSTITTRFSAFKGDALDI